MEKNFAARVISDSKIIEGAVLTLEGCSGIILLELYHVNSFGNYVKEEPKIIYPKKNIIFDRVEEVISELFDIAQRIYPEYETYISRSLWSYLLDV